MEALKNQMHDLTESNEHEYQEMLLNSKKYKKTVEDTYNEEVAAIKKRRKDETYDYTHSESTESDDED